LPKSIKIGIQHRHSYNGITRRNSEHSLAKLNTANNKLTYLLTWNCHDDGCNLFPSMVFPQHCYC